MDGLAAALGLAAGPVRAPRRIVAFVGAGGKTSAMFAAAESGAPASVIVTTTTMIRDPRLEEGRRFGSVLLDSRLGRSGGVAEDFPLRRRYAGSVPTVVASEALPAEGKLRGIHPARAAELAAACDLLLVEADGARGRSIKAPSPTEPVVPPVTDLVVGLVGLDCLGAPLDERIAHRPELLGPLVGCASGEPIRPRHIVALVCSPDGLFKGCPDGARRLLLLNKIDIAHRAAVEELLGLLAEKPIPAGRILVCSLRYGRIVRTLDPGARDAGAAPSAGTPA